MEQPGADLAVAASMALSELDATSPGTFSMERRYFGKLCRLEMERGISADSLGAGY